MLSSKTLSLETPVSALPGIGAAYAAKLARLGIASIGDLLHHYPSRFLDYRRQVKIRDIRPKTNVSFLAVLTEPKRFASRTGKLVISVTAEDQTGKINLTWFNNLYAGRLIKPGQPYLVAGKASFWGNKITLVSPTIEPKEGSGVNARGLVPVYPLTAGISSRFLRQKINLALAKTATNDTLNNQIRQKYNLPNYAASLHSIHFPKTPADQLAADRRLAFNHHLLANTNNLSEIKKLPASARLRPDLALHRRLVESLPFSLTPGQQKAIANAYADLSKPIFSHRLIQGETGSGKTMVVFFLAAQALAAKSSLCLLAPTEILAQQHYQTFKKFGLPEKQLALVTAKNPLTKISQKPVVFIGTHALLSQLPVKLPFPIIALVIDEQHKFGVKQRHELLTRTPTPHLFNLTATPIPRTLALGLFGEVKISRLDQKPQHRLPTVTWVMDQARFDSGTAWLISQLQRGSKVFVVAPTIKARGEKEGAEKLFDRYRARFGSLTKVFLLHGQMKPQMVEKTLADFKATRSGILVATTIIEVGVDISEADVIVIHGAEHFGLATLHQLRGRVGRGQRQGYCLLITNQDDEENNDRLKLLTKYHSGLTLAKLDLRLRGAGELFGEKQHGWLPVRLKYFWNRALFKKAKALAKSLLEIDETEALAIARNLASW